MRSRISLFILIGLFLFIIDYRFSYDEDLNQIIIPDDEILGLIDTWRDQVGRDPSDEEIVRIINNLVNEEILYREALKLELDKNDRIIKRRLAQKIEFLKQDDTQPSTADLEKFYDEIYFHHKIFLNLPLMVEYHLVSRIQLFELGVVL